MKKQFLFVGSEHFNKLTERQKDLFLTRFAHKTVVFVSTKIDTKFLQKALEDYLEEK